MICKQKNNPLSYGRITMQREASPFSLFKKGKYLDSPVTKQSNMLDCRKKVAGMRKLCPADVFLKNGGERVNIHQLSPQKNNLHNQSFTRILRTCQTSTIKEPFMVLIRKTMQLLVFQEHTKKIAIGVLLAVLNGLVLYASIQALRAIQN